MLPAGAYMHMLRVHMGTHSDWSVGNILPSLLSPELPKSWGKYSGDSQNGTDFLKRSVRKVHIPCLSSLAIGRI